MNEKSNVLIPKNIDLDQKIINAISGLPAILDVEDIAGFLRVSTATIRKEITQKRLPAYKIGNDWEINRYDFINYVNNFSNLNHDA